MVKYDDIVSMFYDKLKRSGSLDAALLYTTWQVYKIGLKDNERINSCPNSLDFSKRDQGTSADHLLPDGN